MTRRAWQRVDEFCLKLMKWSGLFLVLILCPLGVIARLIGNQSLYSLLTVLAAAGLAVFFLGVAIGGIAGLFGWFAKVARQWKHIPVEPPLTDVTFETSHQRVTKKLQARHIADFFKDQRLHGHFAWLTNGSGGCVRVVADVEDGRHFLDVFDLATGDGLRTVESEVSAIESAFLDCFRRVPTTTDETWYPLRPRARWGLPPALHLTIVVTAHLFAILGPFIGSVYFCGAYLWSQPDVPILVQLVSGVACFLFPLAAVLLVRVLLSWLPAQCPRCGGGAFWPRSMAVTYCCHRCPGVYLTGIFIRGGTD